MKVTQVQGLARKTWDVLVVDTDERSAGTLREVLCEVQDSAGLELGAVRAATSVDQALLEMKRKPAELVAVNIHVGDNAGAKLLATLRSKYPGTMLLAMGRHKTPEVCLEAWRAGASDILFAPLQAQEARGVLGDLLRRGAGQSQLAARHRRLRGVCRQLNKARHEISQQVDLLCNDLVRAYQEMAQQLNQAQVAAEFNAAVDGQTGLEGLMRASLEWVLRRLGPVNAAIYLPDSEKNFILGAYLNLDTPGESGFTELIGSSIVRQVQDGGLLQLDTNEQITAMFGKPGQGLTGRTWLACGSFAKHECLAAIVVFRGQTNPFEPAIGQMVQAVAPILAERIAQAMNVHNRLADQDESDE